MGAERTRRTRRRASAAEKPAAVRSTKYTQLRSPFQPQGVFSDDAINNMHNTALRILEELGLKILLPEARQIFAAAGAKVDEESEFVFIGRDIVEEALRTAPKSYRLRAPNPDREQQFELGTICFAPGAGCPHANDRERGRRPGSLVDFEETIKLQQSFDAIHTLGPSAEPQDVPVHFRHYAMMRAQLTLADKPTFIYARGRGQVEDCFEMVRLAMDLDEEAFDSAVWTKTVINTNSPRQIDIPMAQGIIDFARANQLSIITPFCLAGAMAPITVSGALTLQHAEALAGIVLAQLARSGSPVVYGGFCSNVAMKSGAPAFGTPEHVQAMLGTGQLARYLGLPWRGAAGTAANTSDAQAAHETLMSFWANVLAGATITLHSAGWLEGGLTFGYEKFINDMEALNAMAELCTPPPEDVDAIGFDAVAEVEPGGHFFAAQHTMERYQTAFHEPLVADLSNFGTWNDAGGLTSTERATQVWKETLNTYVPPPTGEEAGARMEQFIADRTAAGGAPIEG